MSGKEYDNYLITSLISGNEAGITEIYKLMYPKVRSYILKHSGSEDDAKDVMQKALIQLSARVKVNGFQITSSFEGYFFTTCKNVWKRDVKISKNRVTIDDSIHLTNEEHDIALAAFEQDKWDIFHQKLLEISENCQKILKWFFNKTPYIDIAKKLGYATENTVRQRIFKCKTMLKKAIQADARYNELKEL